MYGLRQGSVAGCLHVLKQPGFCLSVVPHCPMRPEVVGREIEYGGGLGLQITRQFQLVAADFDDGEIRFFVRCHQIGECTADVAAHKNAVNPADSSSWPMNQVTDDFPLVPVTAMIGIPRCWMISAANASSETTRTRFSGSEVKNGADGRDAWRNDDEIGWVKSDSMCCP